MQVMTTTGMKTSKVMEEEIKKPDPNINKVSKTRVHPRAKERINVQKKLAPN